MQNNLNLSKLCDGLRFPEGPRWYQGKIWFSDIYGDRVCQLQMDGTVTTVVELDKPSGLGWFSDGRLIIVSMQERRLYQFADGELSVFADLTKLTDYDINDMVIGANDVAYIGSYGFDVLGGQEPAPGDIIAVSADGKAWNAAPKCVMFPNGKAIPADGKRLIVAETMGECLSSFEINADGSLGEKQLYAHLPGKSPDGICLDETGAVWLGSCFSGEFLRVREGGEVLDTIQAPEAWALAPMLVGSDRKDLILMSLDTDMERLKVGDMNGRIDYVSVEPAGAGYP